MKLLNRLYLHPNELLPCYLHRLANANGYRNIQTLMKNLGEELINTRVPSKRLFFGEFDTDKLSYLVNLEPNQITQHRLSNTAATRIKYKQQEYLMKLIDFTYLRICPTCYQNSGELNLLNSLKFKTYCSKHRCRMISVDNETGKRFSWSTHYLRKKINYIKDNTPHNHTCEAEITINTHIDGLWQNKSPKTYPCVEGFNIAEFLDIVSFLSRFHYRAYPSNTKNKNQYLAAHWYLKDWPKSYFNLLEHFQNNPMSNKRLTGIRKCYRDLYDELYAKSNQVSEGYTWLRKYFESYIETHFANGVISTSSKWIAANTIASAEYINEKTACQFLSVPKTKLSIFIREGFIQPYESSVNGNCVFKRSEMDTLRKRLTKCLSLTEASSLLQISQFRLRTLIRSNIITPLLQPSETSRDWLIEENELIKLVKQLKQRASLIDTGKGRESSYKQFSLRGDNFASVICKMLSGRLSFTLSQSKSSPLSFQQFTPMLSIEDPEDELHLTPSDACKKLGINKNVIYDFIKRGFVKGVKLKVNRTTRPVLHITATSIKEFQARYYLRHQLKGKPLQDYELISGTSVDDGIINLYTNKLN
ncbi:TniQ family protein [Shewanella sp. 202IG2-18]|uniref:TniQ family protein n=1 Tax=Parashewanella hymeniacidonis TaxID=2807618 RepID=UPI001960E35F|nr:TniQ family protein [Parashewanella hymeniacidonis]MBM7070674.1 TniQ family protein [Parashewanella hymeniacidonis]